MTWHRHLGHAVFKTVIALAESGADSMVITDLPTNIPGLAACAACIAAKSAHLPHKEGRERGTIRSHRHGRSNTSEVGWRK